MRADGADPIQMEALEWFVRLRDDNVTPADRAKFDAWLVADDSHAAAWRRAEELWRCFDVAQPEFDRLRRARTPLSRRNFALLSALAVGAAAGHYALNRDGMFADHTSGAGERRSLRLADGSIVEIGSDSALSVDFSPAARRLHLHRGEGFFVVAPDPARPFTVRAAGGVTRALGTRFNVKYIDDSVTVAVRQHAVEIALETAMPMRVAEGWALTYGKAGFGAPVTADLEAIEAWRHDRIVFQDVPLRRVLVELERYRRGRIVLTDARIGEIPVTASFDTRQAEGALRTIANTLPIRIFQATAYLTVVYPAE